MILSDSQFLEKDFLHKMIIIDKENKDYYYRRLKGLVRDQEMRRWAIAKKLGLSENDMFYVHI